MKGLSYRNAVAVAALPTASTALAGVTVLLTTDNKPYWCTGTAWVDLTASGGGGSPGGNPSELQYNNDGAFAGAANVEVDNGDLLLVGNSAPVTPAAGKVKLFAKNMASRVFPAAVGPSGLDYCLQPSMWRQKIGLWHPPGNATTLPALFGFTAPTSVGTVTARTVATTNLLTRCRRLGYVSSGTAGSLSGHYVNVAQYSTGDGAGLGGFFYSCRFAFTDAATVSGARAFVGMSSSIAAPTNVDPSTITNCIGVAQLSTDATQLYIVFGGTAAQTDIALGTNFPPMAAAGATNGILYDLTLFSSPYSNSIMNWRIDRIGTAFSAEGVTTIGPNVTPGSTVLMAHRAWRTNNTTASAVGLDIISVYTETDY